MFELCTIAAATDNFSIRNQLGEGGFGPVFKVIHNITCYSWMVMF